MAFPEWIRLDYAACPTKEYRDLAELCAVLAENSENLNCFRVVRSNFEAAVCRYPVDGEPDKKKWCPRCESWALTEAFQKKYANPKAT